MPDTSDVVDRFMKMLIEADAHALRAENIEQCRSLLKDLVLELGVKKVALSPCNIAEQIGLPSVLEEMGIEVVQVVPTLRVEQLKKSAGNRSGSKDLSPQSVIREIRKFLSTADMGITGVDAAVAQFGTLVTASWDGFTRLVSLLPPVHVALVERAQIVPRLENLSEFVRMRLADAAIGARAS